MELETAHLYSSHDVLEEFAVDFLTETFLGILAPVDVQVIHYELDCPTLQHFNVSQICTSTIDEQQQQMQAVHYELYFPTLQHSMDNNHTRQWQLYRYL